MGHVMSADETSNSDTTNWSSSFARARTEMIVTTMIILAMTHLEMNMSRVPALGIELSRSAPKATILAFLFMFYIYFVIVFFLKFLAEYNTIRIPIETIANLDKSLGRQMESLQLNSLQVHYDDIAGYETQINNSLEKYKNETFERHDYLRLDRNYRWEVLDGDVIRVNDLKNALLAIGEQRDEKAKTQAIKTIQDALTEARKLNNIDHELEIKKLDDAANSHLVGIRSVIDGFQNSLAQKTSQTLKDIATTANDVKPILAATQTEMEEIRKKTRSLAKALTWDKLVFGFWVPLIFAVVSVGLSVPQATADMKPFLTSVVKCFLPLDLRCWYRVPPTSFDLIVNFFKQLNGIVQ